ncbi:MAG TPA: M13 family metallopeptidase [Gemmatimonadaceae bacterium]|nr:M13 family metallopeptidase [Gemmatimonadaceae bacterium]
MSRISRTCGLLAVAAALAAPAGAQGTYRQTKPIDPANIDRSANACTDFYQFANGGWLKSNPLPAAYSRWGSFEELGEKNQAALTSILQAAAKNPAGARDRNLKMLGTFYGNCMDSAAAERYGASPLKPQLRKIDALTDRAAIQTEIAHMQMMGIAVAFGFGSTQDAKNSTSVIGGAFQGGLGLPDRDYYFKQDAQSVDIRKNYVAHVRKMLELAGTPAARAARDAQRVMAFETALAGAARTRIELRDPEANYNLRTSAQLVSMTPHFNWNKYFSDLGRPGIASVDIQNPKFFNTLDSLVANAPMDDWKAYLRWKTIKDAAPLMSSKFVDEDFAFTKTLSGAKEMLPRYKRCTRAADGLLGDALGQAYVAQNFTPGAKARALEMVHNLEATFRDRINSLSWMSAETKQKALAKLGAFAEKIGYTDKWRDYSSLKIVKGSFVNDMYAVNRFENGRDLAKIAKPVDRTEWGMSPPTVNAYYNPSMNEIVFPAGILQPPFFSATADDAVNYGGMGSVIGHEMSHGFDDQGAQFDSQGNLKNWWSDADLAAFKQKTGLVSGQYDDYLVLDSVHVQGKLTLGENIGDIGGLNIAYAALQKALAGKPRPGLIDGFTPEQRFFLAWAQIWRQNITPQNQKQRILTDPHSPGRWRANGPVSNMPEFAAAFGCKPGDPMVRGDAVRAVIW